MTSHQAHSEETQNKNVQISDAPLAGAILLDSANTSIDLFRDYVTPLFNGLRDKVEITAVKNKVQTASKIIFDSLLKPTEQQCNACGVCTSI
jgi:hypothetical protein